MSEPHKRWQTSTTTKMSLLKPETHSGIKATLQTELDRILFKVSCYVTNRFSVAPDYASSFHAFYLMQPNRVIKMSMNKCSVIRVQPISFL